MDAIQAISEYRAARAAYIAAHNRKIELLHQHGDAAEIEYQAKVAYEKAERVLLTAVAGE